MILNNAVIISGLSATTNAKEILHGPERCGRPHARMQNLEFGLPVEDAKAVCEEKYKKEVVKLTIQIVNPSIKVIEKDVSATFNDKLGVVGIYILRQKHYFVVQLKN